LKNSVASPPSRATTTRELGAVIAALSLLISLVAWWLVRQGYILYYGDALAHLNISRSVIDSHTPGYEQLGSVWLPALHLLCLPLVRNDWLWSTGLAGTIPVALCFVIAGSVFYVSARHFYGSALAAFVVLGCLVLNPNILYLSAIPMTETVFLAGLSVLLFSAVRFTATRQVRFMIVGIAALWFMCLTRYDGWFLIPFAALWFAWQARNKRLITFLSISSASALVPVYWFAHNWWETGNPLDFANGPYSAWAIQGGKPYPGFHDWPKAVLYYATAGQLCAGWGLVLLGIAGLVCALHARRAEPVIFLLLTPAFYVLSIQSSGLPVRVPQLPPHDYYNSRYGIAVVVFCAFAVGAIVRVIPRQVKRTAYLLPLLAVTPWIASPARESWICWKESEVNSLSRRIWTESAAGFFRAHYGEGQGVIAPFGDLTGIFCRAGIHIREVLHEGNGPLWFATTTRPDLIHNQAWAVSQGRDYGPEYRTVQEIEVKAEPALRILKRIH